MTQYKFNFFDSSYNCTLSFLTYGNNKRTCIRIVDCEGGSPLCTATINLPDIDIESNEVAIKDYSENRGLLRQLIHYNIISQPIRYVRIGDERIPICKLLISKS